MNSGKKNGQDLDLNDVPKSDSPVECSICLELLEADRHRGKAKLQCGHEYHLDCIGSAFNVKGIMQCPNCRDVENGQWLYSVASAELPTDMDTINWMAEHHPFFVVPNGFRLCRIHGFVGRDNVPVGGQVFYGSHNPFEQMPPSSPEPDFQHFSPNHHAPLSPNDHMDGVHMNESNHQRASFNPNDHMDGIHMNESNHQRSSFNTNDHRDGIHMFGSNHQVGLNFGTTGAEWNASTADTIFSGHTYSTSSHSRDNTFNPIATDPNPNTFLYGYEGIQSLFPFNHAHHQASMAPSPSSPAVRRGFPALSPSTHSIYDPYHLQDAESPMPNYPHPRHPWGNGPQ